MQYRELVKKVQHFSGFSDKESETALRLFIKTLATTKGYSTAKQARTVLSLALGLAVRYEAIAKNLKVMDATALTLCRDQKLPISVFSIFKQGALKRVVMGMDEGTSVRP